MNRTITERAGRAWDLVHYLDSQTANLHFAEAALDAALAADTVDETITGMQEARRCLDGISEPDCEETTRLLRETRQVLAVAEEVEA